MANRLQLKRGSGAPSNIFYAGEPVYDQTGKVLYIGESGGQGSGVGTAIASSNAYDTVLEMLSKSTAGAAGTIRLYEPGGTSFITLTSPALDDNRTLTFPGAAPSADQIIKTDASGVLSFTDFFTISADTGTNDAIVPAGIVTFSGTANEIETAVTDNTITIGLPDNVVIGAALTVTTNLTVDGNTTLGDAAPDTVSFGATVSSNIIPSADSTYDLGSSTVKWSNVYATTFNGNLVGNVDNASFISVGSSAANQDHFLTFVDSNNTTRAQESLYTDDGVTYNPSTNTLTAGNISVDQDLSVGRDLTVTGNLRVVGTAVTFETQTVKVEDRLIELGLVSGATNTNTDWDLGVAFNYGDGTTAKKSGIFWIDNTIIGIASAISVANDDGTATTDPVVTIDTYAPVAAGSLYLGVTPATSQLVINNLREAVNLVFDGGTY